MTFSRESPWPPTTIELKASARVNEKFGETSHTNFTSYNRKVLITGEVASETNKAEIERLVSGVPQVQGVYNELAIGPVTSFSTRSNDSYITTRVKSRFVDSGKFNPVHVKVVTEAGTTYLMGLVTEREDTAATEIARTTKGVQKVVRVFEYISEEEARRLDGAAESTK